MTPTPTRPEPTTKMSEQFLLEWLAKEDSSSYGECSGPQLDSLVDQGLAQILNPHHGDYARVMLTDEGWAKLKKAKP